VSSVEVLLLGVRGCFTSSHRRSDDSVNWCCTLRECNTLASPVHARDGTVAYV
jgi:hypothetical protein